MGSYWRNRNNRFSLSLLHGFFLVEEKFSKVICRKVTCTAEEMEEMILAYALHVKIVIARFDNCIGPYQEMDSYCQEFKHRMELLFQGRVKIRKQVNVYYDDPRFPSASKIFVWSPL